MTTKRKFTRGTRIVVTGGSNRGKAGSVTGTISSLVYVRLDDGRTLQLPRSSVRAAGQVAR